MREMSAGERRPHIRVLMPSEDPEALDPPGGVGQNVPGPGGNTLIPWYETPLHRFLQGVPAAQFDIDPAYHVERGHARVYNPGRFNGNTGTRANGPNELGALSESAKTGLTGLVLLGAVGILFLAYKK